MTILKSFIVYLGTDYDNTSTPFSSLCVTHTRDMNQGMESYSPCPALHVYKYYSTSLLQVCFSIINSNKFRQLPLRSFGITATQARIQAPLDHISTTTNSCQRIRKLRTPFFQHSECVRGIESRTLTQDTGN